MSAGRALWRRVPPWVVDAGLVVLAALDAWINLDDGATPLMWACAALGSAGLLLRRRFPFAVFLLTLPMLLANTAPYTPPNSTGGRAAQRRRARTG